LALSMRLAAVICAAAALAVVVNPLALPAATQPIVTAINVRGNAHVPTDKIGAVIRSQAGRPLDTKQLAADQAALVNLGYFSDVRTDIRATPGGVAVTFIVIENPVVSKILFDGNTHVTTEILTALMDTTSGSVLNTNTLRDDVAKINSYYDKLGYTGTRHISNIHIDKDGVLALDVKEGVTITKIDVTGNTVVRTPAILAVMKIKPGTVFSQAAFGDDLLAIQNLYKDLGLQAVVSGDPDQNNPGVLDVAVCEARVGAIEIQGNSKTKDYVIRRLLRMKPGDLITDSRVRRDYEAVNNTQFFKSVDLGTKPFADKCGYITVVWTVVEQRTGTASVGVSYGGGGQYGQGLSGSVSYSESNINGTGNGGSISAQRGSHVSDINVSFTVPYIKKFKPSSVQISVFNNVVIDQPYPVYKAPGNNPFFVLSPANGVPTQPLVATPAPGTVSGPCLAGSTPCANQFANYSSRQAGIAVSLGHPVADFTRLSYGLSATRLFQEFTSQGFPQDLLYVNGALFQGTTPGSGGVAGSTGATNLRSFNTTLARDTRDDVQNPRFGSTGTVTEELAFKAFGSDYQFSKTDVDVTRFFPVRKHSTLGVHLNVGFSSSYNGTQNGLPYNDLFSLSDQQLRGTKFVYYGDRQVLGQIELRLPITADRKVGIVFFGDTGDAPYVTPITGATPAPTPTPPSGPHAPFVPAPLPLVTYQRIPFSLKSDVGIGIRLTTPLLPQQVRIDLATGQQGSHISFGFGQAF
jgi:outer membrane protein assembly complex protein YaeT